MAALLARPARSALRLLVAVLVGLGATLTLGGAASAAPSQRAVTAMSYNLYLGANLQPLFAATPETVAGLAQDAYDHVVQVDFPLRARAIARIVDRKNPDVVGLQEVALWERGATPDALAPSYDFQQILLDALAARGEHYRAVSVSRNFQSPVVPLAGGGVARFTDRDVILVRDSVTASSPRDGRYLARVPIPSPLFGGATIVRGWASVDVTVRGRSFRFVDTHLEAYDASVRTLQAVELAARLAVSRLPVVVVGDLNSRPDDRFGAYGVLTGVLGLSDAWVTVRGPGGGFTSGQTDDLNLQESQLDHRIDYVLYRSSRIRAVAAEVVGEEQSDRTPPTAGAPYGLWPADHAGVVATLRLK